MNVLQLINLGSNQLKKSNITSYNLDSEILLSKVLKKTREQLLTNLDKKINNIKINEFSDFIKRRSMHEPIAYILKEKEFWSKKLIITNNTLIPRPETEILVDQLLKIYKGKRIFILDIGTGSGCILVALLSELKKSKGIGIDISKDALYIAERNSLLHKINEKVKFFKRSLLNFHHNKFDLIVSNPPYIKRKDIKNLKEDIRKYEPKSALDGGNDGLDLIRKVIYKTKDFLKTNGMLALEIGNGQYRKVSNILEKKRFKTEHIVKDYKDNIRCIIARKIL